MFGMIAMQWRDANPDKKDNIRDYATVNEQRTRYKFCIRCYMIECYCHTIE